MVEWWPSASRCCWWEDSSATQTVESRAVWETQGPQSRHHTSSPNPSPRAGSQKHSRRNPGLSPPGIIQSPWRPVSLSSGWADRLEMGKEGKHEEGGGGGDMEKSEQGLKNEEINLPGGRQPRSVLHKAVLGPPRTLAGGGGRRWLLLGPLPLPLSWAPAPTW